MEDNEKVYIKKYLALRLLHWHSSMGDPIYAVGSNGYAGYPVHVSVIREALSNLQRNETNSRHSDHKQELSELILSLQSVLKESDVRVAIVNGFARYIWASAWADKVEDEEGSTGMGTQLLDVAPNTGSAALDMSKEFIEKFEKMNSCDIQNTLEEIGNDDAYDFGLDLAAGCIYGAGELDLSNHEIPYIEISELWDVIPIEKDEGFAAW